MNQKTTLFAALMFVAPLAAAYQVTGPVLDVTDSKIVVQKGKEKWEIKRDKDTKVSGDLKKGSKVTVEYDMTASKVDVKDAKGGKDKKDADKKDADKKDSKEAKKDTKSK